MSGSDFTSAAPGLPLGSPLDRVESAVADKRGSRRAGRTGSDRGVIIAWAVSLFIHMLWIGGMFLLVFPFEATGPEPPPMIEAHVVGDIDGTAAREATTTLEVPASSAISLEPMAAPPRPQGAANVGEAMDALGRPAGGASSMPLGIIGIGGAGGQGHGTGDLSDFGLGAGGGAAPAFFGAGGSARGVRSVVYVVDRSGSMTDTFAHVRTELKRSISSLRRSQKFHVIFFNSGEPLESPPRRLVNAIEGNRKEFFAFLDGVEPAGGTHPENALRLALSLEPDLVYLLSDGINFNADLPQMLHEWNAKRQTRIFTIAYLDPAGREMLEAIARDHGGEFKFVSEYELP